MTEVYKKSDRVYFDKLDIWHVLSNQTNFYEKKMKYLIIKVMTKSPKKAFRLGTSFELLKS